jgi:hypothetical protein
LGQGAEQQSEEKHKGRFRGDQGGEAEAAAGAPAEGEVSRAGGHKVALAM